MQFEEYYMIRLCNPEDAATIAPLVREHAQREGYPTPPEQEPLTDLIHTLLTTGFSDFLLAEVAQQPVGCMQINYRLSTWATAPYAYADDFYVRDDTPRATAIRNALLDYACQRVEGRGCAFLQLDVRSIATATRQHYEHMGFRSRDCQVMQSAIPRRGQCVGDTCEDEHDD